MSGDRNSPLRYPQVVQRWPIGWCGCQALPSWGQRECWQRERARVSAQLPLTAAVWRRSVQPKGRRRERAFRLNRVLVFLRTPLGWWRWCLLIRTRVLRSRASICACRSASNSPTCRLAILNALPRLQGADNEVVTVDRVRGLLAREVMEFPRNTVYKTMLRMSNAEDALVRVTGGFRTTARLRRTDRQPFSRRERADLEGPAEPASSTAGPWLAGNRHRDVSPSR